MQPPIKVLVVDDEPSMLRYMEMLLELEGLHVTCAISGAAAIDLIAAGLTPDVVFLDMLMPEMDGIATLKSLRATNPKLNIVMLSCLSETRKVVETIQLGA